MDNISSPDCATSQGLDRYLDLFSEVERSASDQSIDEAMAERHLALLGIGSDDPVILCAYGTTNRYVPERAQGAKRYDWAAVAEAAKAGPRDWEKLRRFLNQPSTPNLGFISSPGGRSWKSVDEITTMTALVYEIDTGLSRAEQFGLWEKAGLPEPTVVMNSGSKSLHVWFRLTKPVPVLQGREGRRRLSAAIDAVLPAGARTDSKMHNPAQPARLAGGIHPKTGERSRLVLESGRAYDFDELMACCPELPPKVEGVGAGSLWREDPEDADPAEEFPELPLEKPCPLTEALSFSTARLIRHGMKEGQGGRPVKAYSLSKTLQCAELQLQELGQPFTGSARQLFDQFVINSDLYGGDTELAFERHWETGDVGCGELSRVALLRRLKSMASRAATAKVDPAPLSPTQSDSHWFKELPQNQLWITCERSLEQVVEEVMEFRGEKTGQKLTCHRGRFLAYEPEQGYFAHVSQLELRRVVAGILPHTFTVDRHEIERRKNATAAKAEACVRWLGTVLNEDEMDVFQGIAFSNGTYDLQRRELVPHSPDHRLTWAIPEPFQPCGGEPPEAFRRFVVSSFGEEWLPVVRNTLRYLIDPTFKPSRIVMILGSSGSGKGTLERLIERMFPPSCVSVITSGFAVIDHPDKIRQFVKGKRLVTFPDLQGRQFGVGTLYSMTDGGLLTSRTLHESDADEGEAFKGRVVICSTQPPSMEDAGNGMTRRMLVLRTTRKPGSEPDLDLDEKLEAELGPIVSWALGADKEDVRRMLAKGDPAGLLNEASMQAEVQMDPVRSFIDQCLEPKPADYFPSDSELFTAFKLFCLDQKHKGAAQRTFVMRLKATLPHLRAERMTVPGSGAKEKTPAVFFGVGLLPGLICNYLESDQSADRITSPDSNHYLHREQYGEGGLAAVKRHRPATPTAEQVMARKSPAARARRVKAE